MHRQFSLQPFSRHYSHSTNPFLDFLDIAPGSSTIGVTPEKLPELTQVLRVYKNVHQEGTLHTMTFVTVNDYLWLLRAVSQELSTLRKKAMYYLAAAVSDFFLPTQRMVRVRLGAQGILTEAALVLCSQNTRFSQEKEVCSLRWIKYPRFSSRWWTNGHAMDT
jgi:hypothetical protein